jgi:hypothetical protein
MRKVITALLACTALALPLVTAASAQAARHRPQITQTPVYVCDGNGAGTCMSLEPHATPAHGEHLVSVGPSAGAWRWIEGTESSVGTAPYIFSYGPLESQLRHQPVHVFDLNGSTAYCAANSAGGAVINDCSSALDQAWVFDPTTHTLVNMGRSNDEDNWEVLCNPGTGKQLVIGTRDSCSAYHEEWAVVSS